MSDRQPRRDNPGRGRVLYAAAGLLHVSLLWMLPFFPSQDGPTHIYNTVILRDLMHGGGTYGAFYNLHLSPAPNLGAVVPLYALMKVLPPLVAEKVFLTIVITLLVAVMPRLARMVGGRPYPGSFVVFPLLYSGLVLFGFYSLLLGQALWLWAIWWRWHARHQSLGRQWLVTTCSAFGLFLCHLLPCACYLLVVGLMHLLPAMPTRRLSERWARAAVELAVPTMLLVAYAWSLSTAAPSVPYALPAVTPRLLGGLDWERNLLVTVYLLAFAQPALGLEQLATGFATSIVLAWLLMRPRTGLSCRWPPPDAEGGADAVAARRWVVVTCAMLVFGMMIVPDAIGELALIKIRIPSFVCLLIVPLVCCVTPLPSLRRVLAVAVTLAAIVNAGYVIHRARQVRTLVEAGPEVDVRGRFVAGYLGAFPAAFVKPMLHTTSYYCALRDCLDLGNYQAFRGHFFVSFKADPTLEVAQDIDTNGSAVAWERYPGVAYVRGWDFSPAERARVGRTFELLRESGPATVWRRRERSILEPPSATRETRP